MQSRSDVEVYGEIITQLGIDMGIYTEEEIKQLVWIRARTGFGKEDNNWFGDTQAKAWELLGFKDETNHVNTSKNTALRDPLMMYIHRLLSRTLTRSRNKTTVKLKDLWALYCIRNKIDCKITYLFCQLFSSNAIATDPRTPLFGGAWIYQLYKAYGEDTEGTESPKPIALNLSICQKWQLEKLLMVEPESWRFVNSRGHIWDPKSQ